MVNQPLISRFILCNKGSTLIEALVTFPLILLVFCTLIEFGFAVFQWNQTVKAMQLGVRLAAVSNPVVSDIAPLTEAAGLPDGSALPSTPVFVSCGAGTIPCISQEIDRLVFGSDGQCNPDFRGSLPGMCDFNRQITPDNIRATYYRNGLGYSGRPDGAVVTIKLEVLDLKFNLPVTGLLLGGRQITVPAHAVTATSEDLTSCTSVCS